MVLPPKHHDSSAAGEPATELKPLCRQDTDSSTSLSYDSIFPEQQTHIPPVGIDTPPPSKVFCASQSWYDWIYPPDMPRTCQMMRLENIAIPASYLLMGLLQGFSNPLFHVYPLDLGATEAQQMTVWSIRRLPSAFKLIFGFLSDNVLLAGYRRKSYMTVGWLLASASFFALIIGSDVSLIGEERKASPDAPSIPFLSICVFGFGLGFWWARIMGDSIVAEKSKFEPENYRGSMVSSCIAYRHFGVIVGGPLSVWMYSAFGPKAVIITCGVLPLTVLPLVYMFFEVKDAPIRSTRDQCLEIWHTLRTRAVWQTLGFIFVYGVLQVSNAAFRQFLKTTLDFTSTQLNIMLVAGQVLAFLGIIAYKQFMMRWSWRLVYIWTTAIGGLLSAMQILLIQGQTFGLSPFLFALGDDAIAEVNKSLQYLPFTIIMVQLCPEGSEGASYAMFTTVDSTAIIFSEALSTMLLGIWDVSKQALEEGYLNGMIQLTFLTTLLRVSGILFIHWMPQFKSDLVYLQQEAMKSRWGAIILLAFTLLSVLYATVVGTLNIVAPGWMEES